jgi:DnaJ family protein C protein 19
MATPILFGLGAVAAALGGRHLMKQGLLGGKRVADQWVKGGFKGKMDRSEALDILGLKCVF